MFFSAGTAFLSTDQITGLGLSFNNIIFHQSLAFRSRLGLGYGVLLLDRNIVSRNDKGC